MDKRAIIGAFRQPFAKRLLAAAGGRPSGEDAEVVGYAGA